MTIFVLCAGIMAFLLAALRSRKNGDSYKSRLRAFTAFLIFLPASVLGVRALVQSSTELSTSVLVMVCVYTFIVSVAVQTIYKEVR